MLPERLCMNTYLCWPLCKLSGDVSSVPVISSLTVLPSSLGDTLIPMLPSGTLLLTILVLSYAASGFIPSSVVVLACLSSFCSLLPMPMILFFHLQRPPLCGWSEIASQVALSYAASIIVGLAAQQASRPDLIRSPKRVLAHLWEEDS